MVHGERPRYLLAFRVFDIRNAHESWPGGTARSPEMWLYGVSDVYAQGVPHFVHGGVLLSRQYVGVAAAGRWGRNSTPMHHNGETRAGPGCHLKSAIIIRTLAYCLLVARGKSRCAFNETCRPEKSIFLVAIEVCLTTHKYMRFVSEDTLRLYLNNHNYIFCKYNLWIYYKWFLNFRESLTFLNVTILFSRIFVSNRVSKYRIELSSSLSFISL